ncbi:hypothetical protein BCY91_05835 [Pelobium manganitolerans]|uniref:Uncharacterized protein n=1 Tax=Pelobium manganitolerans TaxID=1842495 RepID=A0A419S4L9_9SPHI|nr:hypothetical protein [Pelobium manganitolerans]RKD15048.1 hypothetical protein BCY91_05835 [Pelobium manganitolerans]
MYPALINPQNASNNRERFTEVKRIDDKQEARNFFSECAKRLSNVSLWNYMSIFGFAYHVSLHDCFGMQVNRPLEKGDYVKVLAKDGPKGMLWMKVEDVEHLKERDASEEIVCLTLRETENPSLITELSAGEGLVNRCQLYLRRLINTVTVDIKLANQELAERSNQFLNQLRWENFAKQILLKL